MLINSFSSFVIISWCFDAGILGLIGYSDEISFFNRCRHTNVLAVCILISVLITVITGLFWSEGLM